jgi:hypothetical protein
MAGKAVAARFAKTIILTESEGQINLRMLPV